ncbi:MAG: ankyrin repeat domain-containing protein [Spirochaetales bacterium]
MDIQDANGTTPLMHAVTTKNIKLVKELLAAKADVNLVDKYGQTALMLAAGRNFLGAIKQLIAAKTNLALVSKSNLTALGYATDNGNSEAAKLIRNAGGK